MDNYPILPAAHYIFNLPDINENLSVYKNEPKISQQSILNIVEKNIN